jgi:SAM-dependent methyltransferase
MLQEPTIGRQYLLSAVIVKGTNMSEKDLARRLDRVYGATDLNDLEQAYNQWAESYDEEVGRLGYLIRTVSTGYIGRFIHPEHKVLDVGAGTGLIGSYLQPMGYEDLTAIDLSEGMLERARTRGCYREVRRMVLGKPLDFETNSFDGCYAIGVFTEGHAPPNAFDELIRVVRPGGHIVFSIRNDVYEHRGFREKLDALKVGGQWQRVARSPVFQPYEKTKPDVLTRVFVYRVGQ